MARGGSKQTGPPRTFSVDGVVTRAKNKIQQPGLPDNVNDSGRPKIRRRNQEQMEESRLQQEADARQKELETVSAIKNAAGVEDRLRMEDEQRQVPVNRRLQADTPFQPPHENHAAVADSQELQAATEDKDGEDSDVGKNIQGGHSIQRPHRSRTSLTPFVDQDASGQPVEESGSEGEEYIPEIADVESEDEESGDDSNVSDDEADGRGKRTKKGKLKPVKIGWQDIRAARTNASATITKTPPLTGNKDTGDQPREPPKKKHKSATGAAGLGGIRPDWQGTRSKSVAQVTAQAKLDGENDSMVREGTGFVSDDNEDREARQLYMAKQSSKDAIRPAGAPRGGSRKTPAHQMLNVVKVTPGHTSGQLLSKKQQRGGSSHWTLSHLPGDKGTVASFKSHVQRLAKLKCGTVEPWALLTAAQIQDIVNDVFGEGTYTVVDGDVWCGLVSSRLSNWRNAFSTAAAQAVQQFFKDNATVLDTPDAIADAVDTYLSYQGPPPQHRVFWWRTWKVDEDGRIVKKGIFQHQLILYTLAHAYFVDYEDDIPDSSSLKDDEKPIGALIMAMQAVEHALKAWTTGTYVDDKTSPARFFSADNYGDHYEKKTVGEGPLKRLVTVAVPRATQFVKTVQGLMQQHWEHIYEAATDFLDDKPRKRRGVSRSKSMSSRGSSPEIQVSAEYDLDYTFGSDSE